MTRPADIEDDPSDSSGIIWHRNYPPPAEPPPNVAEPEWIAGRYMWEAHHEGRDGWCLSCRAPRVMSPCPSQVLAQHVMIRAIIAGNGVAAQRMVRLLARESEVWRFLGEAEGQHTGPTAGINVAQVANGNTRNE